MESLNIKQSTVPPGSADLTFLIPRDLFDNHFGEFAKELGFISRLMQHITEGATGQTEAVELESLSSSDPTITLGASLAAIAVLANIVNKFLDAWEKILRIRKARDELSDLGLKGAALEELTEKVETTVAKIVEESAELVLAGCDGHDPGRRNELKTAIRQDVNRLFGQIERGLRVEFRVEPKSDAPEDEREKLNQLVEINRQLRFPTTPNEPLLLSNGEIIEGEIHRIVTRKTSTSKTVTTKKEPK